MTSRTKSLAVALALGLATLAVGAQPLAAQARIGLRAGVNFASMGGDDVDSEAVGTRTGLVAGGFFEAPLGEIIRAHIGAQYSQKGFETDVLGGDAAVKLDYAEIPALLAVLVPGSESLGIRLYVGPTFSFLVKCEGEAFGFTSDCEDASGDSEIKSFDLGGAVGAGIGFGMGGTELLVDGFYNFGFGSVDNTNDGDDLKNEVFSVSAGLSFPLGD